MDTIKGFNDYTGSEAAKRAVVQEVIKNIFERYGFEPAETPVVEAEEFVKGENTNDEAVSDIFRLQDKGNRKLALRYEFTFQLKRLMKNKKLPYKRFQIGPVFRDEPVTGNRFRQFTQCDADIVGSKEKDVAEIFSIISETMKGLKINGEILINNRALLNEILKKENVREKDFENVIREIDKLDKLPKKEVKKNLEKFNCEKIVDLVSSPDIKKFEKYENFSKIKEIVSLAKIYGVNVSFLPSLARGLSYYNGIVFEIKTKKFRETVFAGGEFMFNGIQAVGFSGSLERICAVTDLKINLEKYLIVSLSQDKESIKLAQRLRKSGKSVIIFYGKPSKALEYANSQKISKVIFVGAKEIKQKKFILKNMSTGKQITVTEKKILA